MAKKKSSSKKKFPKITAKKKKKVDMITYLYNSEERNARSFAKLARKVFKSKKLSKKFFHKQPKKKKTSKESRRLKKWTPTPDECAAM